VKRWLVLLSVGLSGLCGAARAEATEVGHGRDFGLGFALGSPTSIVAKYFIGDNNALDFGLGFWRYGWHCGNPGDNPYCSDHPAFTRISLNADYLWQEPIVGGRGATLDWHIGAGGRIWAGGGDFAAAARMPIGLDLTFRKPAFLEVFLELAPALYIVPDINLDIEAFLGVRFYF